MSKFLLSLLAASASFGLMAADSLPLSPDAPRIHMKKSARNSSGLKAANRIINPLRHTSSRRTPRLQDGMLLWQSFENDSQDQNYFWLPEGWSMESKGDPSLEDGQKWTNSGAVNPYAPGPADGSWYMGINFSEKNQDEWLISPEVQLPQEHMYQLSFFAYIDAFYFYDTNLIDMDTFEYTEQKILCDFQVLISADGGEFEVVRDFAQENMGRSAIDLMMSTPMDLEKFSVDLGDYKGKKIKVAFRYVGHDGQTLFLDAVGIGLPKMDLAIEAPLETLYWGFDRSADMGYLNLRMAMFPAYSPVVFSPETNNDEIEYSWLYSDPETTEMVPSEGADLTLLYGTDFTNDFTTRNNVYYPPVLTGKAEGYSDSEVAFPVDYMQFGGKPEWLFSDGVLEQYGLLPFSFHNSSLGTYTIDDPEIGDLALPIFGYNQNTDRYWTNYTFQGENEEGDESYVENYFNYIYPSEAPLVINGVWTNANASFDNDVEFTCSIYPLVDYYENGEWMGQVIADTPIATATCKGSEAIGNDPKLTNYVAIPFRFEKPVVISSADAPAYIVMISGFHNEKVNYFAPFQQWKPNGNYVGLGWYTKVIKMAGGIPRTSLQPIFYRENEHGAMFCAFSINLDAEYPYLESETETLCLDENGKGEASMISYYPAESLEVAFPDCLNVSLSGRYNEFKISVDYPEATTSERDFDSIITVYGPGVSRDLRVTWTKSGVSLLPENEKEEVVEIYTPAGLRVNAPAESLPAGIYILRDRKGNSTKHVIK